MRSEMVPSFRPWRCANAVSSGMRAIEPSGFMISQMAAAGVRPASSARSHPASVCPARTSTPPFWAITGKMCPGCTMSSGFACLAVAARMVRARSAAEMPVVTPLAASIETVNAVPIGARLSLTIKGRLSWRQRSSVSVRQTRPRACVAMKLIDSGVTKSAAMTRSPSFSRSSASASTTMRPRRMSSMSCWVVLTGMGKPLGKRHFARVGKRPNGSGRMQVPFCKMSRPRQRQTVMLYRILLLLVLSCLGVARANAATTLWYERVPSQPSTSPGPRVFAAPGDSFAFVDNTLAHLSISVSGPSGNSARLEMRAPRGETFTTRAYEQTLPGFLDGNLATLAFGASSDPFCSDTGRFTILELTLDSEFQIASLAVDFEARCAADTIYGELRYQSSVPLTKDKPLDAQAPDAFAFIPRTLLRPGLTVTSNATTIYGIRAAAPVSIVGGQYSINGGPFTSAPGFASNRDRIVV